MAVARVVRMLSIFSYEVGAVVYEGSFVVFAFFLKNVFATATAFSHFGTPAMSSAIPFGLNLLKGI